MKLNALIKDLGIDIKNCPTMITECFDPANKEEKEKLPGAASGLSRTLKNLIPMDLSGFNAGKLVHFVLAANDGKIKTSAMYRYMPDTMLNGIAVAIAFQIIRYHNYAPSEYPELSLALEAINAAKKMMRTAAKGAHKGPNTQLIQDAVKDGIRSGMKQQRDMVHAFLEFAVKEMLVEENENARRLLESMYPSKSQMLLEM